MESLGAFNVHLRSTVQSMAAILKAMVQLKIAFDATERADDARRFFEIAAVLEENQFPRELVGCIDRLWRDPGKMELGQYWP